ncbi:hypothetical protein D3C75_836160 [compost metagenome]
MGKREPLLVTKDFGFDPVTAFALTEAAGFDYQQHPVILREFLPISPKQQLRVLPVLKGEHRYENKFSLMLPQADLRIGRAVEPRVHAVGNNEDRHLHAAVAQRLFIVPGGDEYPVELIHGGHPVPRGPGGLPDGVQNDIIVSSSCFPDIQGIGRMMIDQHLLARSSLCRGCKPAAAASLHIHSLPP